MSQIFNIQNSINVTGAIQNIQAGLVDSPHAQHAQGVKEQRHLAESRRHVIETAQSAATTDSTHNESSQRAIYVPLPRRRRDGNPSEDDSQDQDSSDQDATDGATPPNPIKHIDITI